MVALFIYAVVTTRAARDLCVEEAGNNTEECIHQNSNQTCCQSLEYVINTLESLNFRNNNHITIKSALTVSTVIKVIGFTNLSLSGRNKYNLVCRSTQGCSGFYFENVSYLTIKSIVIQGCSMRMPSTTTRENDSTKLCSLRAVYILKSYNVQIKDVNVAFNKGTGIVMYNTNGNVEITNSIFEGNAVSVDSEYPGGGGLYIEFTFTLLDSNTMCCNNTQYSIINTIFRNNSVFERNSSLTKYFYYQRRSYQGLGRGGGLCIIWSGHSSHNDMIINNCTFRNNNATTWGGGAYISLRNNANNNITLINSNFMNNNCTEGGGGGLKVSLLSYKGSSSHNNLHFIDCTFIENTAKSGGGGVSLVSSREKKISRLENQLKNGILFQNCLWRDNEAELGSAIDIAPGVWDVLGNGLLPVPTFRDCTFEGNHITKRKHELSDGVIQEISGAGTLLISNFAVIFEESMKFKDNFGSAIYLQSGLITVNESCELFIQNNSAKYGGAIAFIGSSVLYIEENTTIVMRNNMAEIKGGAIYTKSVYQHNRHSSRSCFLQSPDQLTESDWKKRVIKFESNTAKTNVGHTIYASSLESCKYNCVNPGNNSILGCVATIEGLENFTNEISTDAKQFYYNKNILHQDMLIPGKYFAIPVTCSDELNKTTSIVFELSLKNKNKLELDSNNLAYLSNQKIRVAGINEENSLVLQNEDNTIFIDIKTIGCPPGHNLENDSICQCDVSYFRGIQKCDKSKRVATIINGFWIGQCNSEQCASFCPPGFCTQNSTVDLNVTIDNIDTLVCATNREGRLCGKCTKNHSAYYHSNLNKCGNENLCAYGILFYILSELVPLTILFLAAILSNIRFTSGSATGFILYAQILHSLNINIYGVVNKPERLQTVHNIQYFIYSMFNLNFFHLEQLSFCLWKGANTLDILAWNYITILYTLFLILLTVWLLNRTTCQKICICWRPHTVKNAVIHGLTAFVVMCYSQCARISFMILTTARLTGYRQELIKTVVRFSGENTPFDKTHVTYGLAAIAFICIVVILPPLVLFIYPLCLKVLAFCHLSENACTTKLANKIPMPLFDSFQSCFKDQYRFFSGLYFIYRLVPLLCYMLAPDLVTFYILIEIFLVAVLTLHAVLQPYNKTKHNIIDALIFGNLAIVNVLSLLNHQKVTQNSILNETVIYVTATTVIQQLFIFFPLFCIVTYFTWMFTNCMKRKLKEKIRQRLDWKHSNLEDSAYLPPLRSTNVTAAITHDKNFNYREMIPK